jgi:hypothetical protein
MDKDESLSVVQIDEHNLDKECIRLPSDYLKFAHLAADAKRDVDEIKNRLEVVQADLSKEIRAKPEDFGLDKVTETAISSTILTQPRYQKGLGRLQEAKHKADLAQAVVWALEHKKRTLTLLVELHGMGYFSSPKISEAGKQAVEDMTKRKVRRLRDD